MCWFLDCIILIFFVVVVVAIFYLFVCFLGGVIHHKHFKESPWPWCSQSTDSQYYNNNIYELLLNIHLFQLRYLLLRRMMHDP